MNFGTLRKAIRRGFLAVALGSLFAAGAVAQPASAAPRDNMHREMRSDRRPDMGRDARVHRVNRRIRRNRRQLRRSNREFGRNSMQSRRTRRRLRRERRQRYAMNHDAHQGRRERRLSHRSV